MSSAALSLHDRYPPTTAAARSAVDVDHTPTYLAPRDSGAGRWVRRPGAVISILVHGVAVLAIWNFSGTVTRPAPPPLVVELVRLQAPPKEITLPKTPPVAEQPLALKPPELVVPPLPAPVPLSKAVEVAPTQPETWLPSAPPVPSAPAAQLAPTPAVAPPAPAAAPKQIGTEGIPTDYVRQVYARINSNTDYPREAKMRRQQGKVAYRLTLNPQGALLSFEIESSGVPALDEAAREAIRRAAPFPRLPELGASTYLLAGNIVFKIN